MWNRYKFRYPQNFQQPMFNINPNNLQNNLQSGIHFEPFNKDELDKIKTSVQNKFETSKIENLIQNEYNGSIFYEHVESIINNENIIKILDKIKSNCIYRKNILNEIYESQTQNKFVTKDVQINKINNFKSAINFALEQENESANDLLMFINQINDNNIFRKINFIFNQKLLDINLLLLI